MVLRAEDAVGSGIEGLFWCVGHGLELGGALQGRAGHALVGYVGCADGVTAGAGATITVQILAIPVLVALLVAWFHNMLQATGWVLLSTG